MCLLSLGWHATPDYPFVFAGNRDEYHGRPSSAADWWPGAPEVLGGRDLLAGGSWLGIRRDGRFAVVTNRPDLPAPATGALSRGALVTDWLAEDAVADAAIYANRLAGRSQRYGGFSLIFGRIWPAGSADIRYLGGGHGAREPKPARLDPGVSGLSNTAVSKPWPKLLWLNARLADHLAHGPPDPDVLLGLLRRDEPVPDTRLRGVPALPFVRGAEYGTRSSSVIVVDRSGLCRFFERRFGPEGVAAGASEFEFRIDG